MITNNLTAIIEVTVIDIALIEVPVIIMHLLLLLKEVSIAMLGESN